MAWLIIDRILGNALRWSKPSAPRSEQVTWIRVLGEGWGQGTMCLRGLQPHILVIGPSQALALGSFSSTTSSTQSNSARPSQHRQHPTSDQCSRAGREGLEIVEEQLPGRCWPVPPHHPQSSSCLYQNRTPLESPSSAKTASKVLGTPPFPAFSKQTAHSTSHPRAGTTSLAAAATAATPLPEHVCRHGLSNLCRAPKHVDPQMLHLLLSNCKKFTGSSRIPSPEFRGGSRVRISLSGIPHRRQHCAPPGFSPPSKQGFAPQNLHPGYDPPFPNTSQPGQGRCEPGRGLSGMRTPHALQNPARPAARHGSLRGYRGHSRSCSPPRALR